MTTICFAFCKVKEHSSLQLVGFGIRWRVTRVTLAISTELFEEFCVHIAMTLMVSVYSSTRCMYKYCVCGSQDSNYNLLQNGYTSGLFAIIRG